MKLVSLLPLTLLLATLLNCGCRPQDAITQYEIPKAEAIQLPAPAGTGATDTASEPQRMLGAIINHEGQFWFLKLTGAVDAVAEHEAEFRQVVQSMKFDETGKPQWSLPSGWTQQPASGLRFATLVIEGTPRLETTVTVLPVGDGDLQDGILANLNRWRGQLSLPPMKKEQLGGETETLALPNGLNAVLVNLEGQSKPSAGMGGPFAGGRGAMDRPFAAPPTTSPATGSDLKLTAPDHWKRGEASGMRKASLSFGQGDLKGEVTIIDLARAAGDRLANVNRWCGQIGLPSFDADGLKAVLHTVDVGPDKGDYVELIAGANSEKGQSILGVIVDKGDKTWFIKLQAPTALVLQEKQAFETFVKSVQLP